MSRKPSQLKLINFLADPEMISQLDLCSSVLMIPKSNLLRHAVGRELEERLGQVEAERQKRVRDDKSRLAGFKSYEKK